MADEISISSSLEQPPARRYEGVSPLTAGLLYGGTAALALGPVGLLAGVGAGILANRLRKNFLDEEAERVRILRAEHKGLQNELDAELRIADPEERRLLEHAKRIASEGWFRLESGDETGRDMIERANEIAREIMTADRAARAQEQSARMQFQRDLIKDAANNYRQEFQQTLSTAEELDQQAMRVLDLVAQPDFDPNKPFNKAVLAQLLSTGVNDLHEVAPDLLSAVAEGAPSIGAILGARGGPAGAAIGQELGGIIGAITTAFRSDDFKISREEYNRIALNMRKFVNQYAQLRLSRLGSQARQLDDFARSVGAIPDTYSLGDYISGGVSELRILPAPRPPTARLTTQPATRAPDNRRLPPSERFVGPINRALRGLEEWMNNRRVRPTN